MPLCFDKKNKKNCLFRVMDHCINPWSPYNTLNVIIRIKMTNKIYIKSLEFLATIIPSIMKCQRLAFIAAMCQQRRACMPTSRLDAKRIMCVMMDEKDIKVPLFYAPTEPFSIRKSSLAIGGIMWIAHKLPLTISK